MGKLTEKQLLLLTIGVTVLLTGGLVIGAWAGDRVLTIAPFFFDLFQGALALFLLEMGLTAAKVAKSFIWSNRNVMPGSTAVRATN